MSWVETELREQPVALERFLAAETAHATEIARGLVRDDVHYLLVVSRGSSSNVARYLQYLFGTVNRLTVAFANDSRSPLAQAADWVLSLHAGEERAVAATKTYLNSIAAVALLSSVAVGDPERVSALRAVPAAVAAQIDQTLATADRLDRYRDVESGSVVARGVNYGTAFEIALKIRELSGAPV